MGSDFLKEVREIRGTSAPEVAATDGIYYDIKTKTTEDDDTTPRLGDGMYGSIQVMYEAVKGVTAGGMDDIELVANDLKGIDESGIPYSPTAGSRVLSAGEDLLDPNSALEAARDNKTNIDLVGNNIDNVNAVGDGMTNVDITATNIADVNVVATEIDEVIAIGSDMPAIVVVSDNIADVNTNAVNIGDINIVGGDLSEQWSYIADNGSITSPVEDTTGTSHIVTVSDNIDSVIICADNIDDIIAIGPYADDIKEVHDDIIPALPDILASDDNAAAALASANASESSAVASALSAADSLVYSDASSDSADASALSAVDADTSYNNTLAIYGDTTDVEDAVNAATLAEQGAIAAEGKAAKWSDEAEDVEVEPGRYSAMHHELKAEGFASSAQVGASTAQSEAFDANTAATESKEARDASEAAKDLTEQLHEDFRDAYLGYKLADPTVDNDGDELIIGCLYYNTVSTTMKSWDGVKWNTAFADSAGALIGANNLNDVDDVVASRTNLDVYSKAEIDAAWAAHTARVDNPHAVTKAQVGLSAADNTSDADKPVGTATQTLADTKFDKTGGHVAGSITIDGTVDGRDVAADGTKLDGIAVNANNYDDTALVASIANVDGALTITDALGVSINTLKTPGIYLVDTELPLGATLGVLEVRGYDDGITLRQRFADTSGTGRRSARIWDGATYNAWEEVAESVVITSTAAEAATNTTKLSGIEANATRDQTKSEIDALGINATTVNSLTVETAVPSGALFTDTIYDDSVIDCGTIT